MDELLLIDKPAGMTSHDVVDVVRRMKNTRAVGHAGTLDPFATGLLILGVGKATKQLTALVGLDKMYEATLRLGATSTTFDTEGEIRSEVRGQRPEGVKREEIERVLDLFRGGYDQKAPLFSAKKRGGKKLYELARAGKATEDMRPIKHVTIHELTVMAYTFPELKIRVTCSSGTYIRSLADDIGHALGIGAYLSALRRTAVGDWRVEDAKSLEAESFDKLRI